MVSCMGTMGNRDSTSYHICSLFGNNDFCCFNNFENSCAFLIIYSLLLHKGFRYSAIAWAA